MSLPPYRRVRPGAWETAHHYYPRVPNAVLHPLVRTFLHLGNHRIAERYAHLHPEADRDAVHELLGRVPRHFRWSGADLFATADESGVRRMVLVETNSSPSGQKSMPLLDEALEAGGYERLLRRVVLPRLAAGRLPTGDLAVLWDKNELEVSGYAAVLADLTGEDVHLVHVPPSGEGMEIRDGVVHVHDGTAWIPIRAAFRYVTQRPWIHFPPRTKTWLLNPVIACLAGGRNKLMAAKAYDLFNARMAHAHLRIRIPETVPAVPRDAVPYEVERLGGVAAIKVPYSNAGQGVATVTSPEELEAFLEAERHYDRFVVQALIGNVGWSSTGRDGRLFHVGTVPNKRGDMYVADLRMMVGGSPDGFFPVALYARRAAEPMPYERPAPGETWSVLGTNLSRKLDTGWTTEAERLLLMDSRDFNRLGIGLDDLIEAYLQTVMATLAIDDMAADLVNAKGKFRRKLFASLDPDEALLSELRT